MIVQVAYYIGTLCVGEVVSLRDVHVRYVYLFNNIFLCVYSTAGMSAARACSCTIMTRFVKMHSIFYITIISSCAGILAALRV